MTRKKPPFGLLARLSLHVLLSATFAYAWYTRYFLWVDCFNELGRCYDPDGSEQVYTTGGMLWAVPALVFLVFAVVNLRRLFGKKAH